MAKQLIYDHDARSKLLTGMAQLSRAVAVTLGPTGRHVILDKSFGGPTVTKDGVTVSKEIDLPDPFENMGAKLCNVVASKTSDVAGDGTTTATILAHALFQEGLRIITSGANPMTVRRGIEDGVAAVVAQLAKLSRNVSKKQEIAQVGAISANNDSAIGELLADAIERVGNDGVITVEEGKTAHTTLEFAEGMQFDKGYVSPYFISSPATMSADLEDPLILIRDGKISNLRDFVPVLEKVASTGRPLLVIAEDVDGDALTGLVVNKLRGVLNVCAVKAPGFGDRRKAMLGDIAILTGGTSITDDLGFKLENVELSHLGTCKQVKVEKERCTLIRGAGKKPEIQQRIDQIRSQMDATPSEYDKEKYQERLAKLSGGVAIIQVGAATEAAMKEKKARVEDALHATRAATEEGILPGGGSALLRTIAVAEKARDRARGEERLGVEIVIRALEAPIRQIAANCGVDGSVVADEVKQRPFPIGYDANTAKYVDMFKAGIIDPTKVVRCALQNAASIAALMLTTETMVTNFDRNEPEKKQVTGAVV